MAKAHIRPLSRDVIGQIAAGEVVERPAAAIKELVENSMDAGATAITVDIKDGGLTSFRVVDNGSGIDYSDIRLAFERHATSKIVSAADLYSVQTLGFRGEALASIAAVSKLTCVTRTKGADFGLSVENNGGMLGEIKEAACPEGTAFTVKDLFYNAPVRRKFMKKPSTETGYVSDLMLRLILSHPEVSFRYIADGKTVYFSAGDGKLESAVMSIYGLSTLGKLKHVSGRMNGLLLDGFVGIGELARGNRSHQTFILNGRLIKSNLLTASLEEACRQRVMIGRFPMCILHLTLPFEQADVNVHPNKWEVRFQNEAGIREAMTALILDALEEKVPLQTASKLFDEAPKAVSPVAIKQISAFAAQNDAKPEKPTEKQQNSVHNYAIVQKEQTKVQIKKDGISNYSNAFSKSSHQIPTSGTPHSAHSSQIPATILSKEQLEKGLVKSFSPQETEILSPARTETAQPIVSNAQTTEQHEQKEELLEQKAASPSVHVVPPAIAASAPSVPAVADEVVEQISDVAVDAAFSKLNVRMIGVIFNTYIILECEDRMLLCDQHAVHERLLYERMVKACEGDAASQMLLAPELIQLTHREYEVFNESRDSLKAAGFEVEDFGDMTVQLRAIPMVLGAAKNLDCFRDALDDLADGRTISTQKRTDRIIQMACKHAVKGGEKLPVEELYELARRMITDNITPTCPHGRPLVVEVTHRELDKRFRRIQN